ncbi:IS3 family transposase [Thalassomonas viridans]|uniref:IS3 family transposase n=1 Tax=Thalassomonas viridans TaxID=137584 RepID=A0AAE9ZGS4_9GAMM|nr:IS3 family transposase [Thalassomonas viridans]WDE08269.1 IS3 family transposase [Thalassomonas viridans]WDE09297.1 IS3 family transposase [Thalassomonas viridans]WDE09300.1 IS3 family transposase [Thalassomonas viridans]WDE09324.1 IS3 family transposase [Thalassomonas viridans]
MENGARYFKKGRSLLCEGKRIRFQFIRENKKTWPVLQMCRVMEVSSSAFYDWCNRPIAPDNRQNSLDEDARKLFTEHRQTLGSRRMVKELIKLGHQVGRFKVRRMMARLGLIARYPKKFKVTTDSEHNYGIAPNILARQFDVNQPNQVWTTDITYVWTLQGWMYLAAVMDLSNRQIVGWAIDEHMRTELCVKALQMAYWRRKPGKGLIHHSDRGSQYASDKYRKHLRTMGMQASMSGKGDCWDNAPTERFFRSLKYEQLNYQSFRTKSEAKLSILDYLAYYNSKRPHSKLGYVSPMEYERIKLADVA